MLKILLHFESEIQTCKCLIKLLDSVLKKFKKFFFLFMLVVLTKVLKFVNELFIKCKCV